MRDADQHRKGLTISAGWHRQRRSRQHPEAPDPDRCILRASQTGDHAGTQFSSRGVRQEVRVALLKPTPNCGLWQNGMAGPLMASIFLSWFHLNDSILIASLFFIPLSLWSTTKLLFEKTRSLPVARRRQPVGLSPAQNSLRYRRQVLALAYFAKRHCTVSFSTTSRRGTLTYNHSTAHGVVPPEQSAMNVGQRRRLMVKMRGIDFLAASRLSIAGEAWILPACRSPAPHRIVYILRAVPRLIKC